jgi:predicted porin
MQKKLIVLAVSGALAVPLAAFAQSSNFTMYGRANMGLDRWSATGSTSGTGNLVSRTRIYDSGSRLGLRGSENLGGGMEAYFVMETGINWDTGNGNGQSGAANSSTGALASRDSFLGLKAGWGEVSFGRQSIFWANGLNAQTGANYINTSADSAMTGLGLVAAPVARQSSVVAYTSPRMAGVDLSVAFSPQTQEPATFTGTNQTKGSVLGFGLKYRMGGLYVQADHAKAKNNGNIQGVNNTGDKLGVSYGYAPGSRAAIIYQRLKNANVGAIGTVSLAGDTLQESMWVLNLEHSFGQLAVYAEYLRGGEVKGGSGASGAGGTKSNAYTLAVKQHLSKRTGIYASYNAVKNEANAFADLSGGGISSGPGGALGAGNAGADVKIWGVGIIHNF